MKVAEFIKYYLLYSFAKALYGRHDIWIVAQRGTYARDNGFHMFKYIRTNHSEREVYFVISKDSADRKKVSRT